MSCLLVFRSLDRVVIGADSLGRTVLTGSDAPVDIARQRADEAGRSGWGPAAWRRAGTRARKRSIAAQVAACSLRQWRRPSIRASAVN